jgi:cytochrome c
MFDTMTITKAFGSLCGALLILLLGGWAAEGLYNVDRHGEDHVRAAMSSSTKSADGGSWSEEVVEIAFRGLRRRRRGAGERLWRQCQACHALNPGQNGVGPYLHGVVGRPKHSAEGFGYSDALLRWTATGRPKTFRTSSRTRAATRRARRWPTTACPTSRIAPT